MSETKRYKIWHEASLEEYVLAADYDRLLAIIEELNYSFTSCFDNQGNVSHYKVPAESFRKVIELDEKGATTDEV